MSLSTELAASGATSSIVARGLIKTYGKTVAVDGLDLSIPPGMTFGLLGPNGAGKSSLIRMLVGLAEPDAGKIEILGRDAGRRNVDLKQRIGYVPELATMYRWMRVGELIRFVASFYPRWDGPLCDELLSLFELPGDRKVKQLSKGMTSKLGLLLALSSRAEVLILDEPTSGLDPLVRDEFLDGVLRTQSGADRTVLFSSHHVDEVERIADRVGIMAAGRLIFTEDIATLRDRVRQVRFVIDDGCLPTQPPPQTLWEHINRREWSLTVYPYDPAIIGQIIDSNPVRDAEVIDLTLEEIFKQAVRGLRERSATEDRDVECVVA
jgi:ABC-2 type transport system ATP-binding protein